MKPGQEKIWKALDETEEGLRFTKLKEITGLSAPALSAYLKDFKDDGLISYSEESKTYFIPEMSREREEVPLSKLSNKDAMILNGKLSNEFIKEAIRRHFIYSRLIKVKFEEKELEVLKDSLKMSGWMGKYFGDLITRYLIIQVVELSKTYDDETKIKREVYKGLVQGVKDVILPYYDSFLSNLTADLKLVSENKDLLVSETFNKEPA